MTPYEKSRYVLLCINEKKATIRRRSFLIKHLIDKFVYLECNPEKYQEAIQPILDQHAKDLKYLLKNDRIVLPQSQGTGDKVEF